MPEFVPLWTRNDPSPAERTAEVMLVCFAVAPLADGVKLVAKDFGLPSLESVDLIDASIVERESNEEWFDGWRTGALRAVAEKDLGKSLAALDEADLAVVLKATLDDPPDFGYLQACWGLARWFVARGASVVLDAFAARFWRGEVLAKKPLTAGLDIRHEINMIFETDVTEPNEGHCLHTRGLGKLARPDLVTVVRREDADPVAEVMWQLAELIATGANPAPGLLVELPNKQRFRLSRPRSSDPAHRLGLSNDALMLLDENKERLTRPKEKRAPKKSKSGKK